MVSETHFSSPANQPADLSQTGFLQGHQANGAFVACGPPGFTALALLKLGQQAQTMCVISISKLSKSLFNSKISLPLHNLISPNAGEIWYAASVMSGLMLFGLAVFFFVFGILPYWFKVHRRLGDILSFWALTFPNGVSLQSSQSLFLFYSNIS
jgi:tellurite resistance protein TehA-like permease